MVITRIYKIVGGSAGMGRSAATLLDLDAAIRDGFHVSAADNVKQVLHITDAELAEGMGVSARTLQRLGKEAHARLTPAMSDRLYRLARIMALAEEVFESTDRARQWLMELQPGLANQRPFDMLHTEAGAREVEDLLGRIEYGVYI